MKDEENRKIEHLVVSGGGTYGMAVYGALKELHMKKSSKRRTALAAE